MAQWQEHYTGVLRTSFGPVGVTETQYALIALALVAGLLGPNAVEALVTTRLLGEVTVSQVVICCWIGFTFVLMGISVYSTLAVPEEKHAKGEWVAPAIARSHEDFTMVGRARAVLDLLPVAVLNLVFLFGFRPDMIASMPRVLCLSAGLLFFYMTAQMILFSMACMHFRPIQLTMLPFIALAFASNVAYLPFEMTAIKLTMIVYMLALTFYVQCWLITVIQEIKGHLKIGVFTVKKVD